MMSGQQYHTASVTMKVENLTKVYSSSTGRVVSLDNVSFSVSKGEFVSVVGPSGSGKSTLLNMLGALDRPTSGKVFMDGIDIFNLLTLLSREFKRTIIMVTHNPELAAATDRAIHIRDGAIEKDVINVERH